MKFTKLFDEDFAKNARYSNGEYLIEHNGKVLVEKTPMALKLLYQKEKLASLSGDVVKVNFKKLL